MSVAAGPSGALAHRDHPCACTRERSGRVRRSWGVVEMRGKWWEEVGSESRFFPAGKEADRLRCAPSLTGRPGRRGGLERRHWLARDRRRW
jgi:hypothetical protein